MSDEYREKSVEGRGVRAAPPSTLNTRHASSLDRFGGYQKALELFDHVVNDMAVLQKDPRCYRLIAQQVASADSVCSNIEEGYGRLSRAEYVRFLDFAPGSARETQGRYRRMRHWLDGEVIRQRTELADAVIGILTNTIQSLRSEMPAGQRPASALHEAAAPYGCTDTQPFPLDTGHPTPDTRL